jgi:hypothetical protein
MDSISITEVVRTLGRAPVGDVDELDLAGQRELDGAVERITILGQRRDSLLDSGRGR